jgi:LysR family cys regulon transcriptional activator
MTSSTTAHRAYKEITLQQLRSFCETVHLGSLSAAAGSLGLAHPTVWKQVHSLERHFGLKLVESHTRGCRPTEAGRALAALASPLVTGIDSLKQMLQETSPPTDSFLKIAATQRFLVEDLPGCMAEFERRCPHVRLDLRESAADEVAAVVESGEADLGFAVRAIASGSPWVSFEPCYELDIVLITPPDHPLASRRRVRGRDLSAYPLVNAPTSFADPQLVRNLEALSVFDTRPRRVEAYSVAAIRHYVAMGFGVGLIGVSPAHKPDPAFHERSLGQELGRITICAVRKQGALPSYAVREFVGIIKSMLNPPANGRKAGPRKSAGRRPPGDPRP